MAGLAREVRISRLRDCRTIDIDSRQGRSRRGLVLSLVGNPHQHFCAFALFGVDFELSIELTDALTNTEKSDAER